MTTCNLDIRPGAIQRSSRSAPGALPVEGKRRRRSRWVVLLAVTALVPALPSVACITIRLDNRTWSRDAVEIHEAVAVSASFEFDVYRTWRGPLRERLTLLRALDSSLEFCTDQGPVEEGQPYLLTLSCDGGPAEHHLAVSCAARAEPLLADSIEERIRFLREGTLLRSRDLARVLEEWAAGERSHEELIAWLREMDVIAEVDDWTPLPDDEVVPRAAGAGAEVPPADESELYSLAGGVLAELNAYLAREDTFDACRERQLHRLLPYLLPILREGPPRQLDQLEELEERLWSLEDDCEPEPTVPLN